MSNKLGEAFFREKIDRGFRELGGFFYEGSNIAQPMYQLRGSYETEKQVEGPDLMTTGPSLDEIQPAEPPRDDPGRDDRDKGFERD